MTPDSTTQTDYPPIETLIPAHWEEGEISAANDATLHYWRTGGDKPTLLLLHGVQVDGLMWLRTAQALAEDYDIIMPDFRGHGLSSRTAGHFSTSILVEDTAALITGLDLSPVFVVGHSLGADIAGRLAANYPDLVRGVVLVDPALQNFMPPLAEGDALPPWMQPILDTLEALKTQSHAERMVTARGLLPPGAGQTWHPSDFVVFANGMAHFDTEAFRQISGLSYLFAEPQTIAQIESPILLLTARPAMPGANPAQGLAAFTHHWRNGQHIDFPDSGHFIPFDQFDRFINVVADFLTTSA